MKYLFWGAGALIVYTYAGYGAWLWLRTRLRTRPVHRARCLPEVSVLMVVRNEEIILERKLRNLAALEYPADRIEFIVVSDGSDDNTNEILTHAEKAGSIRAILLPEAGGKAIGLNHAIAAAAGEIFVFTDARQQIEKSALRLLMESFADPAVGCASGELMLGDPLSGESRQGMGLYWKIEKELRQLESASGSVVGATGAFYAVRRSLATSLPENTILDDVFTPMNVVRQGARVVFDSRALAWDLPNLGSKREFRRKVRTLAGNYQLLQFAPWLLSSKNPLRFEFISHKVLRLFMPFALLALLVSSVLAHGWFYRGAFLAQVMVYTLSISAMLGLKLGRLNRICDAASTFVVLNAAAVVAFTQVVRGRKAVWN